MKLRLSCDIAETQESLDPILISKCHIVHIACGAHAGSPQMMQEAVQVASTYKTHISMHPGYEDKKNFGRRPMNLSERETALLILYQWGALSAIASLSHESVQYIKPHGALYHRIYTDFKLFEKILKWLPLMTWIVPMKQQTSEWDRLKNMYKIKTLQEVYADRHYNDEGSLVSRSDTKDALLSRREIESRLSLIQEKGIIKSITGKDIKVSFDLISFHSDHEPSLSFLRGI